MTKQTEFVHSLVGSQTGFRRLCTFTLAAILITGGTVRSFAQAQSTTSETAKPATEKAGTEKKVVPAAPAEKVVGGYRMHSSAELGGVISQRDGSSAMWATMVNEGTGMRVLSQSLDLHSVDTTKTPFFDTLTTSSFGYGGEPIDVSYLRISKGRLYDFSGNFRRDRNYFDYNLLANSLLSTSSAATPALISEPSSLHTFNTVRRGTDTLLTLFPLSRVSFRAGFNHGTNEGPTYSTIHGGGDVQVLQWFRNSLNTWVGGVDVKLAKRSTISYDQFFGFYKGDNPYYLSPIPFTLANGTPTTVGVNTLATATCGSGANKTAEVIKGIVNPYCSQTTVQSQVAPTRTSFPTEQLRFSSHYWDKVSMNGRVTYSGDISNVNHFNETFTGLLARTTLRQQIDTGGLAGGRLAHNKRVSVNADYGIEAELNKYVSIADTFNFWDFRIPSRSVLNSEFWDNTPLTTGGTTPVPSTSLNVNTPLDSLHNYTTSDERSGFLAQKNTGNTLIAIFNAAPGVRLSGGWRYNQRQITLDDDPALSWNQNGLLLGASVQPSRAFRFNINYDSLSSKAKNADTPTNNYTRESPNKLWHFRARAVVTPAKWVNFAVSANDYSAKNDDPLVNHTEHSRDISFATQLIPMESLSFDFNFAHDDVFSQTDMCYVFLPTATVPLPRGAANTGTCAWSASNPSGSPTPPGVTPASTTIQYLGSGYYDAPVVFFSGALSYAPSKLFKFNAGARVTSTDGRAELLNPLMVPGALQSKVVSPFSDLLINIAPQWAWHGNWVHHGYSEGGGIGPAPRSFHGDVITLGVKHAF